MLFLFAQVGLISDEVEETGIVSEEIGAHHINFSDVPITEFIRFVSKICQVNFIFDHKDLKFNITLSSGRAINETEVLKALIQMLRVHGFGVSEEENYYVIHRLNKKSDLEMKEKTFSEEQLLAGSLPTGSSSSTAEFFVYKLKYHQGNEIEESLKRIAGDLKTRPDYPQKLLDAIQTIQWIKTTNSLLFSASDEETVERLKSLIKTLDVQLKQVFIEVLVIEMDVKKSMEFGLQWAGGGKYKDRFGIGAGNFPSHGNLGFAQSLQNVSPSNPPTGLNQIPIGRGFDLGIIGDIILHKGKTFFTLGSLVSALQLDGDHTIILNQKLITQDNKASKIFSGDNIPFTGSIVQTIGSSQQTTANIEYRDVGVRLNITPMLGEDENVVTLDIDQEITEAVDDMMQSTTNEVQGIRTTKTNMATHVHVPDNHFLVLTGIIRNARAYHKSGIPCLGGLPVIGLAFSKTRKVNEKRSILIFVRPHIIHSFEEYLKVTEDSEQAAPRDLEELNSANPLEN